MKIAAVIVTYNRKEELCKNLDMMLYQTRMPDKVLIINNCSTDGTTEYLRYKKYLQNRSFQLVNLKQNIGGAGGFYIGTKMAYEQGYDYVWLMDDDGRPFYSTTLEKIVDYAKSIQKKYPKIMLNSLVRCDEDTLSFRLSEYGTVHEVKSNATDNFFADWISPFNGTLISKELINEIGFPNKNFFIKGDEYDYRLRAEKAGAYIGTVLDSEYYHPQMPMRYRYIGKKRIQLDCEAPWKEYYRARNYTYIYRREKDYKKLFKFVFLYRVKSAVFDENTFSLLKMIFKGIRDGFSEKWGKQI